MGAYKKPHGGELKNLYIEGQDAEDEKVLARDLSSWDLTMRQLNDLDNPSEVFFLRRRIPSK